MLSACFHARGSYSDRRNVSDSKPVPFFLLNVHLVQTKPSTH